MFSILACLLESFGIIFTRLQLNNSNWDRVFPRNGKTMSVWWPLADLVVNLKEIQQVQTWYGEKL